MLKVIKRIDRALRSRKLAVGLILFVSIYVLVATVFPQGSPHSQGVLAWGRRYPVAAPMVRGLGLHRAYTSPVFILAVILLAASTAACALERTRGALKLQRSQGRVSDTLARRLRDRPQFSVDVPVDTSPEDALSKAAAHLSAIGLKPRVGPRLIEARAGGWGLWGSPVFHWALVALMIAIGGGQLMRAEGKIGLPLGVPVADTRDAYGLARQGSLYPGHSGLDLVASDFELDYMDGKTNRGASPIVALVRPDGTVAARQRIYPNNPLRHGALMIHMNKFGLSPIFSVEGESGSVEASTSPLVDWGSGDKYGTTPALFTISDAQGGSTDITVRVPADVKGRYVLERMPRDRRVDVVVTTAGSSEPTVTLRPGETLGLPGGRRLRLDDLRYYVRVSVADDWSVYPIYALFSLAAIALSLSLFAPPRTAWVLFSESEEGSRLNVVCRHLRRSPAFAEQVDESLRRDMQ